MRISLLLLLFVFLSPVSAQETDIKTAVLDLDKIYSNYPYLIEKRKDLMKAEQAVKNLFVTANGEIEAYKKKENEEAKIIQKRDEIQSIIDKAVKNYEQQKIDFNQDINSRIERTLEIIAKKESYDLIFNKSFVIESDNDITDQFISELQNLK